MNLTQETDFTTLGWIKAELDATLKQARQSLESFAANPADVQAMRDCANGLHTTYGTLHMIELYGAALAIEEMERVARGLVDGSIAPREDVYSVLMRGFLQLPDYLERLQSGHKDIPIVLLPLLNDLRAARGEKLLSESVLFTPNIDTALPTRPQQPLLDDALRSTAKALRNEYQHALLRWIREPTAPAPLQRIAEIFDALYAGCSDDPARRLWWIAGAVVEGLQAGAIDASVAVKLLFGKLDREIKRLIDEGETALSATQTKELVKNLLYYLAHAKKNGPRAQAVVDFYQLANLLPTQDELEHAHGSISGHNRALLDTVAGGIREDLLRIKETLNVYLHSPQRDVASLAAQAETLGSLGDTFGMLGMGVPRQHVLEQRNALNRIVNGEAEADEGNLLDIAGGLLVVEASLDDHISRLGAKDDDADNLSGTEVPRAEVVRLLNVLMQEALVNVSKVKQNIVAFIDAPWDPSQLEPTPDLLVEVAGALDMLALRDAVKPINAMVQYIRNELLQHRRVLERGQVNALADSVAAIEYYMEAVREQRGDRDRVLDLMRDSLATLGYWPEIKPSTATAPTTEEHAGEVDSAEAQFAAATSAAAEAAALAAPPAAVPTPAPVIDEELRQVFLDEMDDEITNLRKHFPLWRAEPEETENLVIVRRSFHTLKGSGRLVGALALGDFAWKIENMLNRVLDRSIAASPPLLQVVGFAIGVLPRFRDELSRHERSTFVMDGFSAAIDRLSAGDTSPIDESELSGAAVRTPVAPVETPVSEATSDIEAPAVETPVVETPAFETQVTETEATIDPPPTFNIEPTFGELSLVEIDAPHPAETEPHVEEEPLHAAEATHFAETPVEASAESTFDFTEFNLDDTSDDSGTHANAALSPAPEVDQLLLDVLRTEADAHLVVLDAAVAHGRERPLTIREDLVRAVHTLNGAFAMVEAPQIAQLLAPLEGWLARSRNAQRPFDANGVAILDAVSARVKETLSAIENRGTMPDTTELAARIVALRDDVHASESIVSHVEPPTPTLEIRGVELEPETPASAESAEHFETTHELAPTEAELDAAADEFNEMFGLEPTSEAAPEHVSEPAHSTESALSSPTETPPVSIETDSAMSPEDFESALVAYEALLTRPPAPPVESIAAAEEISATAEETPVAEIPSEFASLVDEAPAPSATESVSELVAEPRPAADEPAEAPAPAAFTAPPAAPTPPAPAPTVHPVPDIDEDLLDIFVLEAQEILDRSDALVLRLRGNTGDTGLLDELRRDLHTIKGGANMSAIPSIGELGHAMESLLEGVVEHGRELDGAMLHAIEQGFDTLHSLVQATATRQPTTMPTALIARIETLSRSEAETDTESTIEEPLSTAVEEPPVFDVPAEFAAGDGAGEPANEPAVEIAAADQAAQPAEAQPQETEPVFAGSEYIRVRAAQLDTMVNGASEVAIYRSRLEQQIASYRVNVVEMEATVSRLREQMRRLELEAEAQMASRFQREGDASTFDPLELDRFSQLQQLSRSLAESMSDLVAIQVGFDQLTRQSESLLMQQSRVSADLQESLMRTRMVPFDSLVPALRRTLRQTAASLGKEALLRVEGAQGEMDRTLLERMKAPLEHMLRNSLAHGIENVPERLAAGKPVEGNVRIALSREATETVLRISDDGRGLDRAAIRRRAIERGLLAPDAKIADRELDAFILASGFSTAESLTHVAGRGVGMDVVSNQIKQLGGSLAIESNPGRGAAFTVRLPFTLGVTQAIIVRLGEANYAIPMNAVQGAVHIARSEFDTRMAAEEPEYTYTGESFPILDLAPLLEETSPMVADDAHVPLLIVRSGDQHAAVRVDAVHGSREIVVKSVGPQITSVPGILGATIMGDGSVIMILDLAPLLRRVTSLRAQGVAIVAPPAAVRAHRRRLIMVVDDSITMRKATSRVLEREEMDVVTAKDGIDAIEKLADRIPDLVVLDIEMPRMDGYQFAEHMKGDARTRHVPIVMVTSRTGDKHRARAQEIGVEGYLGKPYQDAELIKNIRDLLGAAQ